MAIEPKVLADLKAKHGKLYRLPWKEDGELVCEIIIKQPGKHEYRKFRTETLDDKKKPDAPEGFIRECCVYPSQQELTDILEKRPGLIDTWTNKLIELAGVAKDCEAVPL